jgi:transcription antitermination factor NusG
MFRQPFLRSNNRRAQGAGKFVTLAGSDVPAALPHGFIEALMILGPIIEGEERLEVGDSVVLKAGPFVDFVVKICKLDGNKRVSCLLNLFGAEREILVAVKDLRLLKETEYA